MVGRGARSTEGKIGRSAERRFFAERGFSSDFDIFTSLCAILKRVWDDAGTRSGEARIGRSDDAKKFQSVKRRCQKGSERGAEFTPAPPPPFPVIGSMNL